MTDNKIRVIDFLARKDIEDCKLKAYRDQAGIITIGIGLATRYLDGTPIKISDTCTKAQAYMWCSDFLEKNTYPSVEKLCAGHNVPNEVYIALSTFAYNVGQKPLSTPDFINAVAENDWQMLADKMRLYNKFRSHGVLTFSQGLANRREKEIDLFRSLIKE